MVMRNSESVQAPQIQQQGIQSSQIGNARDSGEFQTVTPQGNNSPGPFDALLKTITGTLVTQGSQAMAISQEEAYLNGAQKAGMGEVETTLSSDPLTGNWETAGFRDIMGKLTFADANADLNADWGRNRELSPEKFQDKLAQTSARVTQQLEGMSLEQRKAMLGQQVMADRAAMKRYAKEHTAYIGEQYVKPIQATLFGQLQNLTSTKRDKDLYNPNAELYHTTMVGSVWMDPAIMEDVKKSMITDAIVGALDSNNTSILTLARERNAVAGADGKLHPVYDVLDEAQRHKINAAGVAAEGRVHGIKLQQFGSELGDMVVANNNPDLPMTPWPDYESKIREGFDNGYFKDPKEAESRKVEYWTQYRKKNLTDTLATAWATDNKAVIYNLGETDSTAGKAHSDWMGRQKLSPPQRIASLLDIATRTQSPYAWRKIGEETNPAFAQAFHSTETTPQSMEQIGAFMGALSKIPSGDSQAKADLLGALTEETQAAVLTLQAFTATTADVGAALDMTRARIASDSVFTKGDREARQTKMQKSRSDMLDNMQSTGYIVGATNVLGSVINAITLGTFGKDSPANAKLLEVQPWLTNSGIVNEKMASGKRRVGEEYARLSMLYLNHDHKMLETMAKAAAANSSIPTIHGPLVLNADSSKDIQGFFGVPKSVAPDLIGKALGQWITPKEGQDISYDVSPNGRILMQIWNKAGMRVDTKSFDPKEIAPYIEKVKVMEAAKFDAHSGSGTAVKATDSVKSVVFTGENTALVPHETAHSFRQSLVEQEGVTLKPYQKTYVGSDGKTRNDKQTVGVGLTGDYFVPVDPKTGEADPAAISKMFSRASSDALKAGKTAQQMSGIRNDKALMLFSHLAYQSGVNFHRRDDSAKLFSAMKNGTKEEAQAALHATIAYRVLPPKSKRLAYYDSLLLASLQGR